MTDKHAQSIKQLPESDYPLVPFNTLCRVRCKTLQSVAVAMPPQYLPTDPSAHLFQPPIQVVVLAISDKQVELGIYADEFLHIQQGQLPTANWVTDWQQGKTKKDF